jgi:hypothetical protein
LYDAIDELITDDRGRRRAFRSVASVSSSVGEIMAAKIGRVSDEDHFTLV